MDSAESLQRLRDKLGCIDRENTDRFALIDKRVANATQESKDSTDRLVTNAGEVLARLNERAQRVKDAGGWATESSLANSTADENDFGFEEDEQAAKARADFVPATQPSPPAPVPPPLLPAQLPRAVAPPPPVPLKTGRHVRRGPVEEDDYAETDWTAD